MVLETWFSDFKVSPYVDETESGASPGPRWAHTFDALHELGEACVIGGIKSAKDLSALDDKFYCLNLRTLKWEEHRLLMNPNQILRWMSWRWKLI